MQVPRKVEWEYMTVDHGILRITARRRDDGWKVNAFTKYGSLLGMPMVVPDWGRVTHLRTVAVDQFVII